MPQPAAASLSTIPQSFKYIAFLDCGTRSLLSQVIAIMMLVSAADIVCVILQNIYVIY